ncbi:MAG: hypothetical protein HY318_15535 [Armatimonadetes bacterium]|nr:hypothetical protein [Armatimonadota bacterium]
MTLYRSPLNLLTCLLAFPASAFALSTVPPPPKGIDLAVDSLSVSPEAPKVGEPATIRVAIRNAGQTPVTLGVCPAQIYVNGAPLYYACIQIARELPVGATMVQEAPWTPSRAGQTTITARIQYGGDSNTSNNLKKLSVAVLLPAPVVDVAIAGVSFYPELLPPPPLPMDAKSNGRTQATVEGKAVVGQPTMVQVTIENQGNQRVRLTKTGDVSVTIDGTSLPYYSYYGGAAPPAGYPFPIDVYPHGVAFVSFRWTPQNAGDVSLVAKVKTFNDGSIQPPETDLEDNTMAATVPVEEPRHDLAIKGVEVNTMGPIMYLDANMTPANPQGSTSGGGGGVMPPPGQIPLPPAAGEPAWVVVTVENQGNVTERVVDLQVSINGQTITLRATKNLRCYADAAQNSAGQQVGDCILPPMYFGLPPGGSSPFYFEWTPPEKGTYHIDATVTPVDGEVDQEDNTGSAEVTITEVRIHDLSLDSLTIDNASVSPGGVLNFKATISNKGTVSERGVYLEVYVDSRYIMSRALGTLRAAETRILPLRLRLPARAQAKTYTLRASVPQVFGERIHENNSAETQFTVTSPVVTTPGGPPH